jgi:hypothetical protein
MNKKAESLSLQSIAILSLIFISFILLSSFFLLSFSKSVEEIDKTKETSFLKKEISQEDSSFEFLSDFPDLNINSEGKFYYDTSDEKLFFISKENKKKEIESREFESKKELIKLALLGNFLFSYQNYDEAIKGLKELEKRQKEYEIIRKIKNINNSTLHVSYEFNLSSELNPSQLSLYFFYPKESFEETSQLKHISQEGSFFFLAQKDPVIGMRIQTNESKLSYEVPFSEEYKEELLLVFEDDFFQGPDFLTTYREETCKRDEALLFSFDNFNSSLVFKNESGEYKLCLSHREFYLSSKESNYSKALFYITPSHQLSLDNSSRNQEVHLEILNKTTVDLQIKFQEQRPNETYSCIASMSNTQNGFFGECDTYATKIWLALEYEVIEFSEKETGVNKVWFLAFSSFFILIFLFLLFQKERD